MCATVVLHVVQEQRIILNRFKINTFFHFKKIISVAQLQKCHQIVMQIFRVKICCDPFFLILQCVQPAVDCYKFSKKHKIFEMYYCMDSP